MFNYLVIGVLTAGILKICFFFRIFFFIKKNGFKKQKVMRIDRTSISAMTKTHKRSNERTILYYISFHFVYIIVASVPDELQRSKRGKGKQNLEFQF